MMRSAIFAPSENGLVRFTAKYFHITNSLQKPQVILYGSNLKRVERGELTWGSALLELRVFICHHWAFSKVRYQIKLYSIRSNQMWGAAVPQIGRLQMTTLQVLNLVFTIFLGYRLTKTPKSFESSMLNRTTAGNIGRCSLMSTAH